MKTEPVVLSLAVRTGSGLTRGTRYPNLSMDLAVHRTLVMGGTGKGWTVSAIACGYCIVDDLRTHKVAVDALRQFAPLLDWSEVTPQMKRSPAVKRKIEAIIKKARMQ